MPKPRFIQLELPLRTWGGRRRGAGRKPAGQKAGVPHVARAELKSRHPVHVTMRLESGVPNLRRRPLAKVVLAALGAAKDRLEARVVQFSVQSNHLHLIVEASDARALSRACKGLAIRVALGVNRQLGRRGRVFSDRYHARPLRTPREVRSALVYVLRNRRKHGGSPSRAGEVDPLSSAPYFDGFSTRRITRPGRVRPVAPPRTWLLRVGWRRLGLIGPSDAPVQ
jgi:REP element-mobilizing transposase RayT